MLVLESENRHRLPTRPLSTVTCGDGAHGRLVVGRTDRRIRSHLAGGTVSGLYQCPQVNAQGAGLLLHHAGQLPASDHGNNGCAHDTKATARCPPPPQAGRETVGWRS